MSIWNTTKSFVEFCSSMKLIMFFIVVLFSNIDRSEGNTYWNLFERLLLFCMNEWIYGYNKVTQPTFKTNIKKVIGFHLSRYAGPAASIKNVFCIVGWVSQEDKVAYTELSIAHTFTSVAIETLGLWGPYATLLVSELLRRRLIAVVTGELRSVSSSINELISRCNEVNAAAILDTIPPVSED